MADPATPVPPLGAWAVEAYGRAGVTEACLALQDGHGMDVVAVLWCTWAGAHHGTITTDAMAEIVRDVAPFHCDVVAALRGIRRLLNEPDVLGSVGATADDPAAAARDRLRRQVAEAELAAEMIQLDHLENRTASVLAGAQLAGAPGPEAINANLVRLAGLGRGESDPARDVAIATLLARVTATGT